MKHQSKKAKPVVALVIPSDNVARKFVDSGALDVLMSKTRVVFLVNRDVKIPLPGFSKIVDLRAMSSSLSRRLDLFFWYHSFYVYLRRNQLEFRNTIKALSIKWSLRRLHEILSLPFFAWSIDRLDRYIFSQDENARSALKSIRPNVLIAAGSALDSYSHHILKTAASMTIPTLMVISHWDYFSKKGLLRFKPDKLYVWGDDMRNSALRFNNISGSDVTVVGAPQFQKYLGKMPQKLKAKTELGLEVSRNWLLFPGSGIPYDELSVLKRLSDWLVRAGRDDLGIIYRPHPRAWDRKSKLGLSPASLKNVVVDQSILEAGQSEAHYQRLIAASEGIISPYSTMILEGALCGLPALCVCFPDQLNIWDFSQAEGQEHLRPLRSRDWVFSCSSSLELEEVFSQFLSKILDPEFRKLVIEQVRPTVYFNDETFAERLYVNIERDFLVDSAQ